MNKLALILCIVLIVLGATACKKSEPAAVESAPPVAAPPAQSAPTAAATAAPETTQAAPNQFHAVLTGKIDNNLPLQMELTREGSKLTGSYFYARTGASNVAERTLSLEGKIEKDGQVSLAETAFSSDGPDQKTGEFKGVLDSLTANGETRLRLAGTWASTKTKKSMPVALQERRFDLGGYKLMEKPLEEKNKKLRMEISAILPQLTGGDPVIADKFNKAVFAFINKQITEFKTEAISLRKDEAAAAKDEATTEKPAEPIAQSKEKKEAEPELPPYSFDGGFTLVYASPELLSLLFENSTYFGGAHPSHVSASFNFDLKRGAEVKLADLFTPKSNYLKLISSYSIKELKKLSTTSDVEAGAGPKLENFASWNVTPYGLQFTLDAYQVGAYAVGAHEVVVPYDVLKPVLKPDGLLAVFNQ